METKIFGIIASAAIVVVIALTLINFGNYRSLLPERSARPADVATEVAVEAMAEADLMAIDEPDSLALAEPLDSLQTEQ